MSLFVLTFTRGEQREPALERFEDPSVALARLVELERALHGTNQGAVLLIAEDEATLRRTHTHYFVSSVDELLRQAS